MKKLISLTIALNLFFIVNSQNVGIGTTTPAASAKLEISSNTKGFLPPRMSEAERNNIVNPVDGLLIFNITTGTINFYFNGVWNEFTAVPLGAIGSLNCAGATATGVLTEGVSASGVSSSISYTGGNGRKHSGQTVGSTGVPGLTATLLAGNFANGAGNLVYNISGIPANSGMASFALNIGGRTCTLARMVNILGTITTLNCAGAFNSGMLTQGITASGVSSSVPYTGGNGGTYASQIVTSTGVTGLTATLPAGSFTNGVGNLIFTITGTPSGSGIANFALSIGGQACIFNRTVNTVGTISTLNCAGATNTGTLTLGTVASGVSSIITYTGGNTGGHNGQIVASTGVTGLTATLAPGNFVDGVGLLTFNISGTPASSGTASFALIIGGQTCTLNRTVSLPVGTINALNCETATKTGTLTRGIAANTVSSLVPYTDGNGGTHTGQTVTSTGITGLTATLVAGTFVNGAGNLTYTINGTPASSGIASFALNIGGQTCFLTYPVNPAIGDYPIGTVHCTPTPTEVIDVVNPATGKTWMDRNLGASRVATSSTDSDAYGESYQWGRRADGHQCRNSATTNELSSSDQPANGLLILSITEPGDWRSPQNNNLWQGVSGVNNPCPSGYRVPTDAELNAERLSWSSNNGVGAFASPLKFPLAGGRNGFNGSLGTVGFFGGCWSSAVSGIRSHYLSFSSSDAFVSSGTRSFGYSVRCLKEVAVIQGAIQALACNTATNTGILTSGVAASSVSSSVPYTGGNGGHHTGQTVNSTGVTGLTATLVAGTFANEAGTLTYSIIGTPASGGTASFALNIGGQTCTLTRTVNINKQLQIGDNYAGGIIFYLDSSRLNGLVCAPTDQGIINGDNTNFYVRWGCEGVDIAGTSKELGSGPKNTAAIVAACGENNTAAKICNDLILNGFDDWYLPTEDELTLISQNLLALGLFNSTSNCIDHWSSSQYSASNAYTTFISSCNNNLPILNYNRSKGAFALVRAVRAFKATTASVPIIGTKHGIVTFSTSAKSGGYISSDGGAPVTARGICWADNPNPTTGDNYTLDGNGEGNFNSTINGLIGCGTQYYIRAYATNKIGTAYGNESIFTSGFYPSLPALNGISEITYNSAVSTGSIENNGGCDITARGVCWSIAPNPTTNNSKTIDGLGIGSFVSTLTNLGSNVKYYVRAYATNAIGTVYSEQDSFVTTAPTGLYIGQNYAGGIIFFLDSTGEHGLVCAPTGQGITNGTNINYYVRWGCEGVDISGTSKALGSGPQNTAAIVAACGENNIAAKICNDLILNGFDDWYLPTEDELTLISQNLLALGLFNSTSNCIDHWSSSQYSASNAYTTFISSCNNKPPILNYNRSKGAFALVRAVRVF